MSMLNMDRHRNEVTITVLLLVLFVPTLPDMKEFDSRTKSFSATSEEL